jgi:hypothetical protein
MTAAALVVYGLQLVRATGYHMGTTATKACLATMFESDDDARADKRKHPLLFGIGFGSTGTSTLSKIAQELGHRSCHFYCISKSSEDPCPQVAESPPFAPNIFWPKRTTQQSRSKMDVMFIKFNAFFDVGNEADFKWLDSQFPDARFLLHVRPMLSFLLSKGKHHGVACQPVADDPCPILKDKKKVRKFVALWARKVAAHQAEVLSYFSKRVDIRKHNHPKLALVDATMMPEQEVIGRIRWLTSSVENYTMGRISVRSSLRGDECYRRLNESCVKLEPQKENDLQLNHIKHSLLLADEFKMELTALGFPSSVFEASLLTDENGTALPQFKNAFKKM